MIHHLYTTPYKLYSIPSHVRCRFQNTTRHVDIPFLSVLQPPTLPCPYPSPVIMHVFAFVRMYTPFSFSSAYSCSYSFPDRVYARFHHFLCKSISFIHVHSHISPSSSPPRSSCILLYMMYYATYL